jgi:hypothetical protein
MKERKKLVSFSSALLMSSSDSRSRLSFWGVIVLPRFFVISPPPTTSFIRFIHPSLYPPPSFHGDSFLSVSPLSAAELLCIPGAAELLLLLGCSGSRARKKSWDHKSLCFSPLFSFLPYFISSLDWVTVDFYTDWNDCGNKNQYNFMHSLYP